MPDPMLLEPVLGPGSLLLQSEARHRRDGKLLTPSFQGAPMRAYGQFMREVALRHAACWERGRPFPVLDTTQAISLEVIIRAVFGVVEEERVRRYQRAIVRTSSGRRGTALPARTGDGGRAALPPGGAQRDAAPPPAGPQPARPLLRPLTLLGHRLPTGVSVSTATSVLHRRPEVYPDPDAFRPERFLDHAPSPFDFLPFGGGARRCLGAAFALYELN